MLEPDKLQRIKRIELYSRKLVHNAFAGAYHSVFKGQGMAFDSVRPYEAGDNVRDIDWKVTARTGEPHIKRYHEERERTVMLVLDSSASCLFGTSRQQKRDLAAELGGVIAYTAIANHDRVGLIVFSDKVEKYIPPRKGRNHILHMIHELINLEASGTGTDLSLALNTINRALKPGTIVFLLSDFLLPGKTYHRDLLITSKQHDAIAIILTDPLEQSFPDVGLLGLEDAETGQVQWVDTSQAAWQREFRERADRFDSVRTKVLSSAGIDRIDIGGDGDYVSALKRFFQQRARRINRR